MIYKGRKESRYLDTWKFERQKLEITRRAKVKMIEKADWGRVKGKRKAAKVFFHKEGEIRDLEDCKTRTAAKGCEIVCVCVYLECSDKDGVIWESARCPVKKVFRRQQKRKQTEGLTEKQNTERKGLEQIPFRLGLRAPD
ncbi:uncharacterized protein [Euwallacea similis]|uniref:uncharacterized protein isoform X1 n=1 Tax=Euwallacea similis TaxID=1736056 RepID=UPI003450A05C